MLRFLTAGESHGPALVAILEGMVAGLKIDLAEIKKEMFRRQEGYGRGSRMKIEKDKVKILSGLRFGQTLGSPIALLIENLDWPNWEKIMNPELAAQKIPAIVCPRPGHADLAGLVKFGQKDIRNILERASARETASRVAVGAVCKQFLNNFGVEILSYVTNIGGVQAEIKERSLKKIWNAVENSILRTPDKTAEKKMVKKIDQAGTVGDSLGGIFEVVVEGLPIGLGSYTHWEKRLDGQLAQAVMSIPSVKGVEIGAGFGAAGFLGSKFQDEIFKGRPGFFRKTNHAGGLEGGVSNGAPVVLRAVVKPIATIKKQLRSINFLTGRPALSHFERADVCVVPAAGVVAEAMIAFVLASAVLEKFGGDCLGETLRNFKSYLKTI